MSAWRWAAIVGGGWLALSVLCAVGWARMALPRRGEGEGDMGAASGRPAGGVSRIPYGGGGR